MKRMIALCLLAFTLSSLGANAQGTGEGKPIAGNIPQGPGTLEVRADPPGALFSVFSGYTFIFSATTPFSGRNIQIGQYNICFEKPGYDLFWRTVAVERGTPAVSVTLRAINTPGKTATCIEGNSQAREDEVEDAREESEKAKRKAQWEAERRREEASKASKKSSSPRGPFIHLSGPNYIDADTGNVWTCPGVMGKGEINVLKDCEPQ